MTTYMPPEAAAEYDPLPFVVVYIGQLPGLLRTYFSLRTRVARMRRQTVKVTA